MDEEKVFCYECRNDVDSTCIEKEMDGVIKGKHYLYQGKEAHCAVCGSEIYVAEINGSNLKALYDVFRKQTTLYHLK